MNEKRLLRLWFFWNAHAWRRLEAISHACYRHNARQMAIHSVQRAMGAL